MSKINVDKSYQTFTLLYDFGAARIVYTPPIHGMYVLVLLAVPSTITKPKNAIATPLQTLQVKSAPRYDHQHQHKNPITKKNKNNTSSIITTNTSNNKYYYDYDYHHQLLLLLLTITKSATLTLAGQVYPTLVK